MMNCGKSHLIYSSTHFTLSKQIGHLNVLREILVRAAGTVSAAREANEAFRLQMSIDNHVVQGPLANACNFHSVLCCHAFATSGRENGQLHNSYAWVDGSKNSGQAPTGPFCRDSVFAAELLHR
jgi:hypothetical protein